MCGVEINTVCEYISLMICAYRGLIVKCLMGDCHLICEAEDCFGSGGSG